MHKKIDRLMHNRDFQEAILEGFIEQGILEYALEDNVDSEAVRDELKARRILNDYIYGIIESAKIRESEE